MKLATLCYITHQGKTLMLNRNKNQNDIHLGKWNGLGGKFLPGESPEECVTREVKEESGLHILNPTLRGVLTFPKFANDEDWYVFLYTAREFTGEITECKEGELSWIEDKDLLSLNLWEGDRHFLGWMKEGKFFSAKFNYVDKKLTSQEVIFHNF